MLAAGLAAALLATAGALPPCEGDVLDAFAHRAIQPPRKNSEQYLAPHNETRNTVGEALGSLLAQTHKKRPDYVFALERAALAGYELCERGPLVLFRPVKAGDGQPVFSIRRGPARKLIVEVPHTVFDYRTLEQGTEIFTKLEARALLVAGAHRCASGRASACSGASAVCSDGAGTAGPFRESDMAHAVDSVFQRAHELITAAYPNDVVLSLHGMDKRGMIISDGTRIPTSSTATVARLAARLAEDHPQEPILLCNRPGARDPRTEDLCGTTNVQGRQLNGSADACAEDATRSSGRFLHLEQSPRFRKHPDLLIETLGLILSPTP